MLIFRKNLSQPLSFDGNERHEVTQTCIISFGNRTLRSWRFIEQKESADLSLRSADPFFCYQL